MARDICPSRDDAQPHIYGADGYCRLCGAPGANVRREVMIIDHGYEAYAREEGHYDADRSEG